VAAQPPGAHADSRQPAAGSFVVQLGSFSSRDNAERLVRDMTAKGFNTFIAPPIKTNGRELYRVRVGPTRDRASAEALAAQLKRMGQSGSIVPIS
jgi:DedD protein